MIIRSVILALLLFAPLLLSAQCPDQAPVTSEALTPTIRALLMLERPAALSVEQWTKVIENPDNHQDLQIKIYQEETIDPCEFPPNDWYIMLPGRRPAEKEIHVAP